MALDAGVQFGVLLCLCRCLPAEKDAKVPAGQVLPRSVAQSDRYQDLDPTIYGGLTRK